MLILSLFFGFVVVSIYLKILNVKELNRFKKELTFLKGSTHIITHPSIGLDISKMISLPNQIKNKDFVLVVSAPRCSACHNQIEIFRELNLKYMMVPSLILVKEEQGSNLFKEKYADIFNVEIVPEELITKLHIEGFPSYIHIDSESRIKRIFPNALSIYNEFYEKYRRRSNPEGEVI
ncbi:hypothetical protein AB3Z07_26805 (plasmid) [Metabacillus halosaccharovorans]|uniref:hypothetical protein n=1 Tax=Metabacillus halosaccharovorans TaxID=930124 RepID=UPI00203B7604|nr:hypothetical protein [Metabacillus halosaccharovorans]MCM3444137.1 hypothetical protein [Metabacillus halosaccharovorans]